VRYPVGWRPDLGRAVTAANEAFKLTGAKYRVESYNPDRHEGLQDIPLIYRTGGGFVFFPAVTPDQEQHEPVQV
jgi:hypothetical protein